MTFDYDLFVIGGGSGGIRAARLAAAEGAKVALAEEYRLGGTCVIRGCIPKKLMVYASDFADAFKNAGGYGWSVEGAEFDWPSFIAAKDLEIDRLEGIYRKNLENAGVEVFGERAVLVDAHTVLLGSGRRIVSRFILVASGGSPFVPRIPGAEHVATSNDVFQFESLPARVLIVGGGYIACEFAGILNGMGSEVLQCYRGEQILRGFDDDIRSHVSEAMSNRGIDLRLETRVEKISLSGTSFEVEVSGRGNIVVDTVIYATGRTPNTGGLNLESAGVELTPKGAVVVDEYSQTAVPSIFAIGDVTDRINLTPVAIREGVAFVETVFKGESDSGRPCGCADGGVHSSRSGNGRIDGGAGVGGRAGRCLPHAVPAAFGLAFGKDGASPDETCRRQAGPPRFGCSHRWRGRGGNDPARGDRGQDESDERGFRPHGSGPPHGG